MAFNVLFLVLVTSQCILTGLSKHYSPEHVKSLLRHKFRETSTATPKVTLAPAEDVEKTIAEQPNVRGSSNLQAEKASRLAAKFPKLFSLFTVVKFNNDVCDTTSKLNGTCYTALECSAFQGTAQGMCASGFGTCCLFERTCGGNSNRNLTYFVSNGNNGISQCPVTINKCGPNVCQLRLDFETFTLAPPTATGLCNDDLFIVTAGNPVNAICGKNTGQHMYVDFGSGTSNVILNVVSSAPFQGRQWRIRTTQIPCDSPIRAPPGCLQYFSSTSATVMSFNFDGTTGSQHLANQNYGICFRNDVGYCGIQYQECTIAMVRTFSLTTATAAMDAIGMSANNGIMANSCADDFLLIPCASAMKGFQQMCTISRICGQAFSAAAAAAAASAPVFSWSKPFVLSFHTDNAEAETNNRGFCLTYVQQPCT